METASVKVYPYRWVVLFVFAILNIVIQIHWVTFAPITGQAASFYQVTPLQIGMLSMIFMFVYVLVSIPASYIVDSYGIRKGIGLGALLVGIFGLMKGFYAESYIMVCVAQTGLAVAQPFILNSYTKLGAKWFPIDERATAAGIAALSQYMGIIVALAVTPYITASKGMEGMLMLYGIISLVGAAVFMIFVRDEPPTPPGKEAKERFLVLAGLKHLFKQRDMVLLLIMFFIGLGIFNAVTTWIEQILAPRGINPEQAGLIGGMMMVGGVIGAIILPVLSDKMRRRKPFMILTMVCIIPGLLGLTFAQTFTGLLVAGFILGFFIMSAGPIGFQYGAEVSYPAPESTSQGMILWVGQISGIIFIFGMDMFRSVETGSMRPFMLVFAALMVLNVVIATRMRESRMITQS